MKPACFATACSRILLVCVENLHSAMHVHDRCALQVRTRKGNYYSVRLDKTLTGQKPPLSDILCVPRGLLKKIKQKVLVGDKVKVVGIDWPDAQGNISCFSERYHACNAAGAFQSLRRHPDAHAISAHCWRQYGMHVYVASGMHVRICCTGFVSRCKACCRRLIIQRSSNQYECMCIAIAGL